MIKIDENMKHVILILAFLSLSNLYGHQDRFYEYQANNVIIRIKTGYEYAELSKAEILSRMIRDLTESMNYCENVQLDFIHDYTKNRNSSDLFVSFKKAKVIQKYESKYLSKNSNGANIIVRNASRFINFEELINLVEVSILNEELIKKKQVQYKYDGGYNNWTLYSVPQDDIVNLMENRNTSYSEGILTRKYYRKDKKSNMNYFSKDNRFYFIDKSTGKDSIILVTDSIHQFSTLGHSAVIIENSCSAHFYSNEILFHLKNMDYCSGIWKLFKLEKCSENSFIVNYVTGYDDPEHIYKGVSIEVNITDKISTKISEFICD